MKYSAGGGFAGLHPPSPPTTKPASCWRDVFPTAPQPGRRVLEILGGLHRADLQTPSTAHSLRATERKLEARFTRPHPRHPPRA